MKKYLALILALVMVFALAACGKQAAAPVVDTCILKEADEAMINNYSLLAVNPEAPFADADGKAVQGVEINAAGAAALINWLLSEEGQGLAADYGVADYGEHLFYLKEDRPVSAAQIPAATDETRRVRLSTTTSVNDSGLLDYLLPVFHATNRGYR